MRRATSRPLILPSPSLERQLALLSEALEDWAVHGDGAALLTDEAKRMLSAYVAPEKQGRPWGEKLVLALQHLRSVHYVLELKKTMGRP